MRITDLARHHQRQILEAARRKETKVVLDEIPPYLQPAKPLTWWEQHELPRKLFYLRK